MVHRQKAYTVFPKWSTIEKRMKKTPNEIKFETIAKAKKFLEQMQSIHDKYSRRFYWREGKTVYRD